MFTDRTKAFEGDALAELSAIAVRDGKLDHATLPAFVRASVRKDVMAERSRNVDGETVIVMEKVGETIEVERDLGAMISMLTVATSQLNSRLTILEARS